MSRPVLLWYVTGTYHGSHVYAVSEGDARRAFHDFYKGESIVHCTTRRCTAFEMFATTVEQSTGYPLGA